MSNHATYNSLKNRKQFKKNSKPLLNHKFRSYQWSSPHISKEIPTIERRFSPENKQVDTCMACMFVPPSPSMCEISMSICIEERLSSL